MQTITRISLALCLATVTGIASAQALSQQVDCSNQPTHPACANAAPEPGTLPLLLLGVAGAIAIARFVKRK